MQRPCSGQERSPVQNSVCLGSVSLSPYKVAPHKPNLEQEIAPDTPHPTTMGAYVPVPDSIASWGSWGEVVIVNFGGTNEGPNVAKVDNFDLTP